MRRLKKDMVQRAANRLVHKRCTVVRADRANREKLAIASNEDDQFAAYVPEQDGFVRDR